MSEVLRDELETKVEEVTEEITDEMIDQETTAESVAEETVEEEPMAEEPVAEESAVEDPVVEEPVAEESAVEDPVVEEPVAEEPAVEDPVAEEPVAEEPAVEDSVVEEPVAEEPAVENPVVEEPAIEDPVAEEPVTEEPVVEELVAEEPVGKEPSPSDVITSESKMKKEEIADETMSDYEEHFDDANPWNLLTKYMKEKTNLTVVITGVVNKGVLTNVEGEKAFIPASQLSLSYVEDLEVFLNKEMEVRVTDVDQSKNRLVLSAKDILKERESVEKAKQIQSIPVGSVAEGIVETLQNYGAFVRLDGGLSGLVHVSQISHKRIKTPGEVLKVGNKVKVKIIGIKDGKISLSIKALDDRGPVDRGEREYTPKVDIPKSENIGTSLGDLFKDIKLD